MHTTHLSSKGQVIIPKTIRMSQHWESGQEFEVINAENGVLLKPIKQIKKTTIKDVIGCTGYKGPRRSLKEMDEAIKRGVRKINDCY